MRIAAVVGLAVLMGGCAAVPPVVSVATLSLDSASYAASGKSVTDHAISTILQRDCALLRVLKGERVCRDFTGGEAPLLMASSFDPAKPGNLDTIPVAPVPAAEPAAEFSMMTAGRSPFDGPVAAFSAPGPSFALTSQDLITIGISAWHDQEMAGVAEQQPASQGAAANMPSRPDEPAAGYLVVGSFTDPLNAENFAVRNRDLDMQVVSHHVDGKQVFRVVIDRSSATHRLPALRQLLARRGIADIWVMPG